MSALNISERSFNFWQEEWLSTALWHERKWNGSLVLVIWPHFTPRCWVLFNSPPWRRRVFLTIMVLASQLSCSATPSPLGVTKPTMTPPAAAVVATPTTATPRTRMTKNLRAVVAHVVAFVHISLINFLIWTPIAKIRSSNVSASSLRSVSNVNV